MKNVLVFLAGLIAGALLVTLSGYPGKEEPWKPVFEDTGFVYLQDLVKKGLAEESGGSAETCPQILKKIDQYYIPLTEARQCVYDADRFCSINEYEAALRKLNEAGTFINQLETKPDHDIQIAAGELRLQLDKLIHGVENERPVFEQFEAVGHRINMMLLKGELILSDVEL